MTTTIALIRQLREETGAGIMDCRQALEEANSSYAAALAALRDKALADAAKRSDCEAAQGMLEIYSHGQGRIGVMVEINTETDFAARSAAFRAFAHEIALHIAAAAPRWVSDREIPPEVIEQEEEKAAAIARAEGQPEDLLPRIVKGRVEKYKTMNALLNQASIRDEKTPVSELLARARAQVGENILIRRFARWELGEGE